MENRAAGKGITRGQLARRAGCNLETVRYYERIGLMPDPGRTSTGYRQYDAGHQDRLCFIVRGRELGFSISDLKRLLDLVDRRAVSCADVKSITQVHLADVRQKMADLRRMEHVLIETAKYCSGAEVPECPLIDALFGVGRAGENSAG